MSITDRILASTAAIPLAVNQTSPDTTRTSKVKVVSEPKVQEFDSLGSSFASIIAEIG